MDIVGSCFPSHSAAQIVLTCETGPTASKRPPLIAFTIRWSAASWVRLRLNRSNAGVKQFAAAEPARLALHPFVAAAVVLAVAMGVGRFAYTPLLILMRGDAGLTVRFAGTLASANLAGYLVGALLAMHPLARANRTALVRVGAILVVVTTAAMALPPAAWVTARCAAGVASGVVFVLTASLLLDLVAKIDSRHGLAVMFSGVGIGIAIAGLLVTPFASLGGSRAAWLGLAAVSAVALAFALPFLPGSCKVPEANYEKPIDRDTAIFGWLAVLYGVEGAAYIVPATFLVAMVSETPSIARYGTATWVLVWRGNSAVDGLVERRRKALGASTCSARGMRCPSACNACAVRLTGSRRRGRPRYGTWRNVHRNFVAWDRAWPCSSPSQRQRHNRAADRTLRRGPNNRSARCDACRARHRLIPPRAYHRRGQSGTRGGRVRAAAEARVAKRGYDPGCSKQLF